MHCQTLLSQAENKQSIVNLNVNLRFVRLWLQMWYMRIHTYAYNEYNITAKHYMPNSCLQQVGT